MSGRHVVGEIVIREAEYEKLVRIRYRRHIRGLQQEIVIVGNPQRVKSSVLIGPDVRAERNPFDLRRDAIGGDTVAGKRRDEIQEQSLSDGVRGRRESILVGDVHRVGKVDFKELFYHSIVARPVAGALAPFTVAFIYEELMTVDCQNFVDALSRREQVRVLLGRSTGDLDGDDAQKIRSSAALAGILDQC